jgi:putative transposase
MSGAQATLGIQPRSVATFTWLERHHLRNPQPRRTDRHQQRAVLPVRHRPRQLVQEALEKEQAEHLERGRYERRSEGAPPHYRNGYEPGRMLIGEGEIEVLRPQVRGGSGPYRSRLWSLLSSRSEAVERLVVEMYARGLSTRDIEDLFRSEEGEVLLSRTSVSEMTDRLWEEYEAFRTRDLSEYPLAYLIVDGVYEAMRRVGNVRDGILVAWGILEDGRRVLLHLELGRRESYESCLAFLRGMQDIRSVSQTQAVATLRLRS